MSLFSIETFRFYAESIGITNLKDKVLQLLVHDTEYRVREIVQEAAKFMRHSKRQKLSIDDVNYALRLKHIEPIYGYDPSEPLVFKTVPGGIFYLNDKDIDFDTILTSALPRMPQPISFTTHWLAIEGVQPQIPENPISNDGIFEGYEDGEDESGRLNVKHHLSREHQIYFDTITSNLLSLNPASVQISLTSLRTDAGIQQLIPYFIHFIFEMVRRHLRQLSMLSLLLNTMNALLTNPHLFIEPYLHQVMPVLLTCVVGKRLSETSEEDHWSLREQASQLIIHICQRYSDAYPTIRPRIIKTLLKALMEEKKSLPSKYGALFCFSVLSNDAIELFILPNVQQIYNLIANYETRFQIEKIKCLDILLRTIGSFLREKMCEDRVEEDMLRYLQERYSICVEIFGDKLLPFIEKE